MIDYETTRLAFEAKYRTPCERGPDGEYIELVQQTGWEHWCRALEYAAQQPAPAPLLRPDKPGWWWWWNDDDERWECHQIGDIRWAWNGLWLPATPPPVLNDKDLARRALDSE